ncbi:hypothetical protein SEA_BLUEFEATHER_3 [Arthrobacter phage BlueFeather]|uniref:Uncharacterized protein n=1 Tax=Arthrobacter phage BlueFeather TaxID=2713258 RepID=A0A6G8R277_9CAUD|nr:hypothetical protein QEX68_gp03 [Arthrobacter phage BlueFeather]QIN94307.1 hypothetical protein SEA_BLUEFEATHER_3 [Arthrobacter phage BlueFeather]
MMGPDLDFAARYESLNRRRVAYAELTAEDLLAGFPERALRWAEKYAEIDARIKRIVGTL